MLDNEYTEALSKQGTSQPNPFANLRTLELGGLNLTDTQTCSKLLEAMPNLEVLTITDTGLTTLPSNISTKTNLRELNLIGRNSKLTVPEDLHNKADLVIYRKNLECHNQA
jgi:Leucine-rich repeat (LRR) protein